MRVNELYKKTLPVNLLLEGKNVLVVGGGRVAEHKLIQLIKSGCLVTVVAPEITDNIKEFVLQKKIEVRNRSYQEKDLQGQEMVITATNNHELNRQILEQAKQQKILIGCTDEAWSLGDFVSPAVVRQGIMTISVSSGGLSCRTSRMVKQNLEKYMINFQNMNLLVIGISHQTIDLVKRERFMLSGKKLDVAIKSLLQISGIQEFMILVTCNRVEFVGIAGITPELIQLIRFALGFYGLTDKEVYCHKGEAAFEHLSFTLAGLYSQTPGEKHIVAQVKDALQQAKENNLCGNILNEWVNSSLHISRQIRQYLLPLFSRYEIENLTVKYLQENLIHFSESSIAVIGTGMVGKQIVEELSPLIKKVTWGWHLHCPQIDFAKKANISLIHIDNLFQELYQYQAIICVTSSESFILKSEHQALLSKEKIYLIDLCNPRNIDPMLQTKTCQIINLDDLKYWFRREQVDMEEMFAECRKIVAQDNNLYLKLSSEFANLSKE